nr:unnamed protein product [Callosobruchus chinensis]
MYIVHSIIQDIIQIFQLKDTYHLSSS